MKLFSTSVNEGEAIPARYAFARIAPEAHIAPSDNLNPHPAWTDAPAQTGSFVLICHDPDVPSRGDDVNQDDRSVPAQIGSESFQKRCDADGSRRWLHPSGRDRLARLNLIEPIIQRLGSREARCNCFFDQRMSW